MPESPLRLICWSAEFIPKAQVKEVPERLRGIYVLYRRRVRSKPGNDVYDVLYVGMAAVGRRRGIRGRLRSHVRSSRKGKLWSHFSLFCVWDNVRHEEIAELEGLFRHIYRRDSKANSLNIQKGFKQARDVRKHIYRWTEESAI